MVYLAEQPAIGRKVALKVIHKELADNHEIVTRFFNEARAVNQIGNEHIVAINDLDQSPDGEYFFVMEYLDGRTLALVLAEDGPLDVRRALHVSAQIADALGATHRSGVIHRDLKPDNVMLVDKLGDPDFVKVLDFGLAKMFFDASSPLTARGVILGTPHYMAPEACKAKLTVDHRADIYALGVLMFEMTTGRIPFDGRSTGEIMRKQITEQPPSPIGWNESIPPAVEQIILRCLAKSAADRFQTMDDLRGALLDPESYMNSGPPLMTGASVDRGDDARTLIQARPPAVEDAIEMSGYRPKGPSDTLTNLVQPVVPKNDTIRMQTDVRSARRPAVSTSRRPSWATVLALALSAIVIGLLVALMTSDDAGDGRTAVGDAARLDATDDVVMPSVPAASPARPATVRLTFNTTPSGAEIVDQTGQVLGTTPHTIEVVKDDNEHVFTLRHPQSRERQKTVHTREHQSFEIELEPRRGHPFKR